MSTLLQWTGKAVRGETIDAETEDYWDFTYVLDIAAGIRAVLDAPSLTHEADNLNRGVQVSAQELVSEFREASPSANINLRTGNDTDMPQSSSSGRIMDSSRIRDDLHFET
jgi:nucleoside-diphosphate-sugar epimerase